MLSLIELIFVQRHAEIGCVINGLLVSSSFFIKVSDFLSKMTLDGRGVPKKIFEGVKWPKTAF